MLYLLSAILGAIVALAVYIFAHKASLKGRGEAIIQKAELEAEQIKQQKILQAKEKFLQLKGEHDDYISSKNKQLQDRENAVHQKESQVGQQASELGRKQHELDSARGQLRAQMENLDKFVGAKRRIHDFYDDVIAGINSGNSHKEEVTKNGRDLTVSSFPVTDGGTCWFSGIFLPEGSTIEDVRRIADELKKNDIEGRTFWKPIHLQPMYAECPRSELSVTESVWQRVVTLPCSTGITDEELESVKKVVTTKV